ncbi:helix-turn-helix domain-containing protein [Yinghuangia sp. YIM S09857]|uniref:AraC family transcriptional regulator n=1 Tax=Yinghuangia sp. YIM S09857 TaxID=3436929 RepID=UPI003F52D6CE
MRRSLPSDMQWWTDPALGVLGASGVDVTAAALRPSPQFAHVVDRFWVARWAVRPGARDATAVALRFPEANVVLHGNRLIFHGILRNRHTMPVTGSGAFYGAALRPGAAVQLIGGGAADHTDRVSLLAQTEWGLRAHRLDSDLWTAVRDGLPAFRAAFERHLRGHRVCAESRDRERIGAIIDRIREDGTITRVRHLTDGFHLSIRTVQRLFLHQVGVNPKWLLRRSRIHHAAARLERIAPDKWSELAGEFGYFDDSHFARDFAETLGVTPYAFARRAAPLPECGPSAESGPKRAA